MTKETILVLVRAIPEKSKKYGYRICVAGINENSEWRRLYPFKFEYGKRLINFSKKDQIKVNLTDPDNDKRKESRKVISYKNLNKSLVDKDVVNRIKPLLTSVEVLNSNKLSLGIIKPILEDCIVKVNDTKLYDAQTYFSKTSDFLEKREKVKMPIELRYKFKCSGESSCKGHKIILIDWELNELARNLLKKQKNKIILEKKIKSKFYNFMLKRDLYFIMGTYFRYGTWMIIGVYYPEKGVLAQKDLSVF